MSTQAEQTSIRTEVVVEAPQDRAFRVFTEQFDKIKPREHTISLEQVRQRGEHLQPGLLDAIATAFLQEPLAAGDPDVHPSFVEAGEIAERFADPDATMFARLARGYSLILQGRVVEGMALLDEVMVSVTADEVAPLLAGIAYCQVIALSGDVRSASREGVDGGADALVRFAARHRSVPRQLSRASLRDLPVAGRMDGRPGIRTAGVRVARRATDMGCARIGVLSAGRDPAAAR